MKTPDISVIMPAYNHEKYVGEAIESVLSQTFEDFEFIIINDGSPDQTENVIQKYADPRIRYYSQENQGAHHALNRGIELSRGEYLSIINSDDLYHRERLHTLRDTATKTGARFLVTGVELIDAHTRTINDPAHPWLKWYERAKSFYLMNKPPGITLFGANYTVTTSNFFFHSSLIEEIGVFKSYKYAHDYDFVLRVANRQPGQFTFLPNDKLLFYRMHGKNTILNRREALDEVFGLVISHLKEIYGADIDIPLDRLSEIMNMKERQLDLKHSARGGKPVTTSVGVVDTLLPRQTRRRKLYDLFFMSVKVIFFEGWSSFASKARAYLHQKKRQKFREAVWFQQPDKSKTFDHAGSSHSVRKNLERWSSYKWPQGGDEWAYYWGGAENQWYATIYPRIREYLPAGHILEIAPGFGRCTQYLLSQCTQLTVVDLTPKCIDHCKKRFAEHSHIRYFVNDGTSLDMVDDNTIDFVFSWDSLVHAESDVLQAYLKQLAVKLKPGGYGFFHHSNLGSYRDPASGELTVQNQHWRSGSMSAELFRQYCDRAGLTCVSQEIIAWGGTVLNDCFSIFGREPKPSGRKCVVVTNIDFMQEARQAREGAKSR